MTDASAAATMATASACTLEEHLGYVRSASGIEITSLVSNAIGPSQLPLAYLNQLCDEDRITASRVCLLAWAVTGGTQIPRELQLRACLAIALNLLLDDPHDNYVSITISPLKRLQMTQVNDFKLSNGLQIGINEDTPREDAFWNVSTILQLVDFLRELISPRNTFITSKPEALDELVTSSQC